jgi:hypothetical protein
VAAGLTYSIGGGESDGWLVRLDRDGRIKWQRSFGGALPDQFNDVALAPDGGFLAVGVSASGGSGN